MAERSCGTLAETPLHWVRRFSALEKTEDAACLLSDIVSHYGLKGYLLIDVPSETSTEFTPSVLLTNWPEEMLRGYDEAGLALGSPVIHRLRTSTNPFAYDTVRTNRGRVDGKAQIAVRLFEDYSLPRGAYFPAHNSLGQRGALAFGGDRESLSVREMTELNALANVAYARVQELKSDARQSVTLSRREAECLSWASVGKTSIEMSEIMGLSEYTVNHYLNRATRKLDAVNRVQAVVKAIRAGLLN